MEILTELQMVPKVAAIYGSYAIRLEARLCHLARKYADGDFPTWGFATAGEVGFWVPMTDQERITVHCPGMQTDVEMDQATLGAAVTLMAVNHTIWIEHEAGRPIERLVEIENSLKDFAYEPDGGLDATAIADFLD